jgi:Putative zincin peptidase
MKLIHKDLENNARYRKILEISHEELIVFVSDHIRPDNLPMRLFYLFNFPVLAYILYKLYIILFIAPVNWFYLSSVILLGFILFALIVIPLHELLHAVAFKLLGASKVSIHAQWGKMLFYAIADKFVMNTGEFVFLALTPFVVINLALIIAVINLHGELKVMSVVFLFFHLTGCIGDFSLLGFLYKNRQRNIVNYDDKELEKSFFYEEVTD